MSPDARQSCTPEWRHRRAHVSKGLAGCRLQRTLSKWWERCALAVPTSTLGWALLVVAKGMLHICSFTGLPPADEVAADMVKDPPPAASDGRSSTFHTPGNNDADDAASPSAVAVVEPNSQPCSHSRGPEQELHCVPFAKIAPFEHIARVWFCVVSPGK